MFSRCVRRHAARLVCLLCAIALLPAVLAESLYETTVPLAGAEPEARTAAMRTALETVLMRVSGRAEAGKHPALAETLRDPVTLVQQYRQQEADATGTPRLWVAFDAQAINRALQKAGLPFGAEQRPATLVWVALTQGDETLLAGDDTGNDWEALLRGAAKRRALPLILPLYDLEDQQQLGVDALVNGDSARVLQSSARYRPQAVLTARLSRLDGGTWQGEWRLFYQQQSLSWVAPAGALDSVLAAGLEGAADRLIGRAQNLANQPLASVNLKVSGITGLAQFAATETLLRALPTVESVQAAQLEPGAVGYTLRAHGGATGLQQALQGEARLVAEGDPAQAAADGALRYRYQP